VASRPSRRAHSAVKAASALVVVASCEV
jgi:hypothetical protein